MEKNTVTEKPVKPKPILNAGIGFVSGVFFGIFAALLKNAIKTRKHAG